MPPCAYGEAIRAADGIEPRVTARTSSVIETNEEVRAADEFHRAFIPKLTFVSA